MLYAVSFVQVSQSSAKVGDLVAEITAASSEQAEGIDQVNRAVTEMDKVVQQNAASAEESAGAAQELNAQSEQMQNIVEALVKLVHGSGKGQKAGATAEGHSERNNVQNQLKANKAQVSSLEPAASEEVIRLDDRFQDF